MGISRHNLAATTQKLAGANGEQIKLVGTVFLNLTVGYATNSQMVYMTAQVTCVFLSQKACKGLCTVHLDFPVEVTS